MSPKIGKVHNSFLSQPANQQKVLVIVPHEDDEINLAGSIIYDYVQKGADVYCAFTTNGDYSFAAATRIREATQSLEILGVKHIIFLGYGDTSNNYAGGHLFYSEQAAVTSPAGHKQTYGAFGFKDYAFSVRGKHSNYSHAAMRNDLETLLLQLQPEIIFCVDLDIHVDHRAASIIFEEAMNAILTTPNNSYQPIVFKGFAYCTSFFAPRDFYVTNIFSVPPPLKSEDLLIGFSLYSWEKRIRFPVLPACRGQFLHKNILYRALFQHASQSAALHAVSIANGDSVFWLRRTDNLIDQAGITATSGDIQYIANFQVVNITNINDKKLNFKNYLWHPSSHDTQKTLIFSWKSPQMISYVEIGGNIENTGHIQKLKISFDNHSEYELGPLPSNGNFLCYKLPRIQKATICRIQILEEQGKSCGISYIGLFEKEEQRGIQPYLKLMINNQFVYDYFIPLQTNTCQLGVYRHGTTKNVTFHIFPENSAQIDANNIICFSKTASDIHVRVELEDDPTCYDEICIHRKNIFWHTKLRILQFLEDKILTFYLKKHRKYVHIQHKYLHKL